MQAAVYNPRRGEYDRRKSAQERDAARRRLLLDTAASVFAERGFTGSSVAMIVERARVSRRAFYAHFDNLQDALQAVAEDARQQVLTSVVSAISVSDDDNPAEQLRAGMIVFLTRLSALGPLARVLNREAYALGPDFANRRTDLMKHYAKLLNEKLQPLHDKGVIKKAPCEITSFMLMSGIYTMAMNYVEEERHDEILELIPHIIELVARAYI
jgi:AcrR family transcriptional regulator